MYGIFDQAVTITYMEQGFDDKIKANEVLGSLIVKGSNKYNQADFLYLLRQTYPDAFIVEEGNVISIGRNKFIFTNGKLISAN